MKSGIYLITNTINNKEYIGKARDFQVRERDHYYLLNKGRHHNIHMQNAWNKYGKHVFKFEIVEYCELCKLVQREKWWVDLLELKNPDKGYNINDPAEGRLGIKHTEVSKSKISANRKMYADHIKRICDTCGNTFKVFPSTVKYHRALYCSRACSSSKKWEVISPDGKIAIVTNLKKFCEDKNLCDSTLVAVAHGRRAHHKNWKAREVK